MPETPDTYYDDAEGTLPSNPTFVSIVQDPEPR